MFIGFKRVFALLPSVAVFALVLGGCSSLFGEEFGEEFSRAVGWEKPEIDDKDIKSSPPLTVPPDYDLVAPADGGPPPNATRTSAQTPSQTPSGTAIRAEAPMVEPLPALNPPTQAPRQQQALGQLKTAAPPKARRKFNGYDNIPAGVRNRFDNSLDRYSTINRRGLGKEGRRQSPVPSTRSPTAFSAPAEGVPEDPDSRAITSEESKPEPQTFDGNLCEKVAMKDGRYRCLD